MKKTTKQTNKQSKTKQNKIKIFNCFHSHCLPLCFTAASICNRSNSSPPSGDLSIGILCQGGEGGRRKVGRHRGVGIFCPFADYDSYFYAQDGKRKPWNCGKTHEVSI